MSKSMSVQKMTAAALLIAVGIVIPMFSPAKIVVPPASFTLASHVPVFLAMFISPTIAVAVAAGTTLGFLLGPFPTVIALRAATHLIFVLVGSFYLKARPQILQSAMKTQLFSFLIAIIHAVGEVGVVTLFYFGGNVGELYYNQGFLYSVLLLIGFGTVVHSMADFLLSLVILKVLGKQKAFRSLFLAIPAVKRNASVNAQTPV